MTEPNDERFVDKRAAARMNEEKSKEEATGAAGAAATADSEQPPESSSGDLAAEREKAETYYKNWQRAAADFANFKRRTEQEKVESSRLMSAALVINLLPVYDDLDRAVSSVDAHLAGLNWVQGVTAIHHKFGRLLEAMGVREVEAEGQAFDPARHEAVGRQPGEEGKVLHVVQKGYQVQDKVIRPAMVIVGEASTTTDAQNKQD